MNVEPWQRSVAFCLTKRMAVRVGLHLRLPQLPVLHANKAALNPEHALISHMVSVEAVESGQRLVLKP